MLSRWEKDSDKELMQDNLEHMRLQKIRVKPLLREEDEWDKVTILNLCKEDREQRLGGFAGDGLPVPVPCKACLVECQAFELCP